MTMLIVEQGSVIQSQGSLIKTLMRDSVELWGMKGKFNAEKIAKAQEQNSQQAPPTQAQAPVRSPFAQIPSAQIQSNQVQSNQVQTNRTPTTQVPSVQTPSTQGIQQHSSSRTGKLAKPATKAPPVPADDLVDHRRALVTI
jgi:hypothetical protein